MGICHKIPYTNGQKLQKMGYLKPFHAIFSYFSLLIAIISFKFVS